MQRSLRLFWIVLALLGGGLVLLVANNDSGTTLGLDNADFARLVSLGSILIFIGAGLFYGRRAMGDVVRNLAIWLLLLVVLMAGYLYRYELQDIGSRLSAGLIPGSPLSVMDGDGRLTVTLDKARNGHFEVRAEADGTPVAMMVDTGATTTVLSLADARAVGIDVDNLSFNVPISTANGVTMAARGRLETLAVGRISRTNLPILVAQEGSLGQSLIGMNFMGTLAGYDVRGDRMILRD